MKKIIRILIIGLSLLYFQSAFSLSKDTEKELFDACISGAGVPKNNDLNTATKFCNCYTNKLSEQYPDDEKFLKLITDEKAGSFYIQGMRIYRMGCALETPGWNEFK